MPSSTSRISKGYSTALVSALLLSTTAIFIRILTKNNHMPAMVLALWRDVIGSSVVFIVFAIFKPAFLKIERKDILYLVLYGLVLALFNVLWTFSVALNGAAIATVLVYSSAAFTAILGRWLLKESIDWVKILAIVLTFAGCVFVSGLLDQAQIAANLIGILTGILGGLLYAVYSLMGRFASQRGLSPWTTLPYIFAFASVFLLGINFAALGTMAGAPVHAVDILWREGTLGGWAILFVLAVGPTILGFGGYLVSLSYLPSSVANLLMTSEPVFTAITAYFFLAERMTLSQIGGSLLILAGVVFMRIMEGRKVRSSAETLEDIQPAAD